MENSVNFANLPRDYTITPSSIRPLQVHSRVHWSRCIGRQEEHISNASSRSTTITGPNGAPRYATPQTSRGRKPHGPIPSCGDPTHAARTFKDLQSGLPLPQPHTLTTFLKISNRKFPNASVLGSGSHTHQFLSIQTSVVVS